MKGIKIKELFYGTDADIEGVDTEREVRITECPEEADESTLLFLTKKSKGESRDIRLKSECLPLAIVCDIDEELSVDNIPIIRTANTRRTLAFAYSNMYVPDYEGIKIIGVTGTNGKTSVATMLQHILTYSGYKCGFIGTGAIRIDDRNLQDRFYSMTTPDPHLLYQSIGRMKAEGCEYIVMEVSSHALALRKTDPIPFELSVFTNLSSEHMDFHTDMEDYFKTKLRLFHKSKQAVFNIDDSYARRAYALCECEKTSIGILRRGDAYATDIVNRGTRGSSFFYREASFLFGADLKIGGAFNIYNALLALKSAIQLGIKPCIAKRAINSLSRIDGRMETIKGDITVIIDYAHTPTALENILRTLKTEKNPKQSLWVVIGCGGERDREKRAPTGRICQSLADKVILTEDNSRSERTEDIISEICAGMDCPDKVTVISDRAEAIAYAIDSARPYDIVAVIGKGQERYIIDSEGYREFDERVYIRDALEKRGVRANAD